MDVNTKACIGQKVFDDVLMMNGKITRWLGEDTSHPVVVRFSDGNTKKYTGKGTMFSDDKRNRLHFGHDLTVTVE